MAAVNAEPSTMPLWSSDSIPQGLEMYARNIWRRFPEIFITLGAPDLEASYDLSYSGVAHQSIKNFSWKKEITIVLPKITDALQGLSDESAYSIDACEKQDRGPCHCTRSNRTMFPLGSATTGSETDTSTSSPAVSSPADNWSALGGRSRVGTLWTSFSLLNSPVGRRSSNSSGCSGLAARRGFVVLSVDTSKPVVPQGSVVKRVGTTGSEVNSPGAFIQQTATGTQARRGSWAGSAESHDNPVITPDFPRRRRNTVPASSGQAVPPSPGTMLAVMAAGRFF